MTLRERFAQLYPGRFFLDVADVPGMEAWLRHAGWIAAGERVRSAARAGEGNMNCTLRVETAERSFILKQARPWVEKYPSIDAPEERAAIEAAFYQVTGSDSLIRRRMPRLIGWQESDRVLMLEDLGPASDFTSVYSGGGIGQEELQSLTDWLAALHKAFRAPDLAARFENRSMRALNHAHIFALPLQAGNGFPLDSFTPGLSGLAALLQADEPYCRKVEELGRLYLSGGSCLVHGDFFPGSWLRAGGTAWVIDPEFCFWGVPEFDWGVLIAHLVLAGQEDLVAGVAAQHPAAGMPLAKAFAGVEIMRRLIGIAQLPLCRGLAEKARLLERSRALVVGL